MQNGFFRVPYAPSVPNSDRRATGGLPGLLQQVMRQQGEAPNDILKGTASPQELARQSFEQLGGMLAASGSSDQSDNGGAFPQRDPNFRELVSRSGIDAQPPQQMGEYSEEWLRKPEGSPNNAEIIPVGGFSAPMPGRRGFVLPQPKEEDVAALWKGLRNVLQFYGRMRHGTGGGSDEYRKCLRAAAGDTNAWEELCRSLKPGWNNVVGPETVKRACWSKTFESSVNKKQWCENQFGQH